MKPAARPSSAASAPGVTGTARVERRIRQLLPRLRPGDIAVIDHVDLDRVTAQSLVDAQVAAVLNAAPMVSGRFPNLGPAVLLEAGVLVLDGVEGAFAIRDGDEVRVHGEVAFVSGAPVAMGRELDAGTLQEELGAARQGLATQLHTFTHNSTELLRREEDLFLHGRGLPRPATRFEGRSVVVVSTGPGHARELAEIRAFVKEQDPVLVGVDRGADALLDAGYRPHVVVLTDSVDQAERPRVEALRRAKDVVVRVDRGGRLHGDQLERLGLRPLALESSTTTEDAALLLAEHAGADLVVAVGRQATFEEFLDRQHTGQASGYLTRLKVGNRYVDAHALAGLYTGRVRPWHLLLVYLGGMIALLAALSVTPVGQEWARSALDQLQGLFS
jgi:uncharacterized membrane-anchored protein